MQNQPPSHADTPRFTTQAESDAGLEERSYEDPSFAPIPDHPLAGIFPMMPEEDLEALADDIEIHGQRAPITLLDAQILDGRNRYRACLLAGVEPITREFRGDDPLQFVLSANLHRRHLSESQRAMVAAKIATVTNGGARAGAGRPNQAANLLLAPEGDIQSANLPTELSNAKAAASLNVSERSVRTAKVVLKDPEQTSAVEAGRKTVSAAAKEMKEKAARTDPDEIVRDTTGYPIPAHLIPLWNRASEIFEIQKIIARAKRLVRAAYDDEEDRLWAGASMQSIGDKLHCAQRDLDGAIPYAVCSTCQGHSRDQCLHCKGKGFLSKHCFDLTVPEIKAIRAKSCVLKKPTPPCPQNGTSPCPQNGDTTYTQVPRVRSTRHAGSRKTRRVPWDGLGGQERDGRRNYHYPPRTSA